MSNGPWIYSGISGAGGREFAEDVRAGKTCTYCRVPLVELGTVVRQMQYVVPVSDMQRERARRAGDPIPDNVGQIATDSEEHVEIMRCPACGWWIAWSPYPDTGGHTMLEFGYGQLRPLDPANIAEPVEAIRAYLAVKYSERFRVDPRKFEEVVCSIFRDLGYRARLTSYSGDGGIDVYLDGPEDILIGVQVKRYATAIKVDQINALTGALVINDCAKGIFVTTSRYQRGAVIAAKKAAARGWPIELYDAARFFDALQIAQARVEILADDPKAPWMTCEFPNFYKEVLRAVPRAPLGNAGQPGPLG